MSLDHRSLDKLQGVRPELANVIKEAAEREKFRVTEGLRSKDRQAMLVKARKSKTMNSRHITGHAVDFIAIGEDGIATYDMDDMRRVADVIQAVANEQGVKIERGIDWGWDAPHIELDRKAYPAQAVPATTIIAEQASKPPAVAATGVAVGAGSASTLTIPSPPQLPQVGEWTAFAANIKDFGMFCTENWQWVAAAIGVYIVVTAAGAIGRTRNA